MRGLATTRVLLNLKRGGSRFVPESDTAFWNGVAYEMVKLEMQRSAGDVIDWEFLAKYTAKGFTMDNMPDDAKLQENVVQGYLLGEYDDTPKTAAWASLICGAPEQDIKDMAAIMSKQNNVILATGTAAARCTGVGNYPQVIYTIGLMGGHMGKQGNAVFYNLTAMNYVTKAYTGARGRAASSIQNPLKFEAEPGVNLAGIPSVGRNLIAAPLHWRTHARRGSTPLTVPIPSRNRRIPITVALSTTSTSNSSGTDAATSSR